MVLLTADTFLLELQDMYLAGVEGSVFVTMKAHVPTREQRPVHHGRSAGKHAFPKPGEPCTLVRATCGKKKISTLVHARDHMKFQLGYANVLRTCCSGALVKASRKKKKKKASAAPA